LTDFSAQLGIPTANIPIEGLSIGGHSSLESGIYYGWCTLDFSTISSTPNSSVSSDTPKSASSSNSAVADLEPASSTPPDSSAPGGGSIVYPTVLSIGYNPFYANTHRSIEIHILHQFPKDFYGATLSLLILGYIRPEYDYVSKEALVEDIREDIRVAQRSLAREAYQNWSKWLEGVDLDEDEVMAPGGKIVGKGVGQTDSVGISYMGNQ